MLNDMIDLLYLSSKWEELRFAILLYWIEWRFSHIKILFDSQLQMLYFSQWLEIVPRIGRMKIIKRECH